MRYSRRQIASPLLGLAAFGGMMLRGGAIMADVLETDGLPPNVFFSPCGQPFRARRDADYPVGNWFRQADRNGDGQIDHAEFIADALAFFRFIDLNSDGVIDRYEISVYERKIAPEVIGGHVELGFGDGRPARKWLAQIDQPGQIDPGGDVPNTPGIPKGLDETGVGASPFSFFQEPEPVMAADLTLSGVVTRANFLKLADMHFTTLDEEGRGFLTLEKLPRTAVQKALEKARPRHRKS